MRSVRMLIKESKLRQIIRSVIREGIDDEPGSYDSSYRRAQASGRLPDGDSFSDLTWRAENAGLSDPYEYYEMQYGRKPSTSKSRYMQSSPPERFAADTLMDRWSSSSSHRQAEKDMNTALIRQKLSGPGLQMICNRLWLDETGMDPQDGDRVQNYIYQGGQWVLDPNFDYSDYDLETEYSDF